MIEFLTMLFEYVKMLLQLDVLINSLALQMGPWLYLLIFLVIFSETGLVFMPFLPGDSLLFAVGALSAASVHFDIKIYIPLLFCAAIFGDSTNYFVGSRFGRRLFEQKHFMSRLFKVEYLIQTERFYDSHGPRAVMFARFFPILRTLAPFVAGLTKMSYRRFIAMSVIGTVFWVNLFCLAGYFFGQIPIVRENFTLLVMGIILISVTPLLISITRNYFRKRNTL